jgi:hypothetical protein
MRSSTKILVAAAATLLVAPQFAIADDIEAQLRAMNERMAQVENQLQATQDELSASKDTVAAQQEMIEQAGLDRQARSGLSAFLSQTQFDGFLSASWTWNFMNPDNTAVAMNSPFSPSTGGGSNNPSDGSFNNLSSTINGENSGTLGLTAPQHSNHNSFQVDQLWFSMKKPATAESRGGWGADLVWGAAADTQSIWGRPPSEEGLQVLGTGDLPHLYQAYVEYLMPVGSGVYVKGGRFETLIGAESFRQDQNLNISRGLLWALQPVNHTGLMVGGDCDCGLTWAVAAANSYSATMADADNGKTLVGRVGYRAETFSFLVNGLYGGDASDLLGGFNEISTFDEETLIFGGATTRDEIGLIDVVGTWDPIENLSLYFNFDYYWLDGSDVYGHFNQSNILGAAVGSRLALSDRTGVAIRYEYLQFQDTLLRFFTDGPAIFDPKWFWGTADTTLQEITGTIDHALTENLTVLAEVRYDWATSEESDDYFFVAHDTDDDSDDFWTHDDQVLGIIQLMYRF